MVLLAGCGFSSSLNPTRDGGVDGTVDPDMIVRDEPDPPMVGYRRTIDITDAMVTGSHTNFPLLVKASGSWLGTAPAGHVVNASGSDIRFTADAAGTNQLVYEIESYSPTTGELTAWVRVPTLSAATVIYMHYGDPAKLASGDPKTVWTTAGYGGVWHLSNAATDASGQNSATNIDGTSIDIGQFASARRFDGLDDRIDVGSASAIDGIFAGGGTIEAWFNAASTGENGAGRIMVKGSWLITFANGGIRFFYNHTSTDGDWQTGVVSLNQWHHVAVGYNGATATIYIDGADATTQSQNPNGTEIGDATSNLEFGNEAALDRTFDGTIDEVRVSTGLRDAAWIATEYRNQVNPGAFAPLGPE